MWKNVMSLFLLDANAGVLFCTYFILNIYIMFVLSVNMRVLGMRLVINEYELHTL